METLTMTAGATTYVISRNRVPSRDELPWGDEECDAFVAILDPKLLTGEVAEAVCSDLAMLGTDWVETMGQKAEYLHDLVDNASVRFGRQSHVGDGNPMTAWHENISEIGEMIKYVRLGGLGASDNKLIVILGPPQDIELFVEKLQADHEIRGSYHSH